MQNNDVLLNTCPLCGADRLEYRFVAYGRVICSCLDCGHLFANPQAPQAVEQEPLYEADAFNRFMEGETSHAAEKPAVYSAQSALDTAPEGGLQAVMLDCLDTLDEPLTVLGQIHSRLQEGGKLFLFVPTLDSSNAKRMKQRWKPFEQKRLHFFSNKTIQNLLCKTGFGNIKMTDANADGIFVSCECREMAEMRVLSIIIPVYNEKNTVQELLDTIYRKDFTHLGLKKEMIIVESQSSDGTHEIVERFGKEHPEVKVIFEEKPQGKGHAVRSAFGAATGDFITIQDGDLEYDVNDYDKLLLPLVKFQEPFVLGSRHTGDWQMRKFGGEQATAFVMNVGQIIFTALINFGCGTKLKDPFTMYKLFRRECLRGLTFDGNRFEIDWEIVIKLTRKGFVPIEIPINYNSRGIKEGKKVRMLKDPILWLICFVRYRYVYKI